MRKVVLVTGSQRGIGYATILKFAKNGYDVVIDYYEEEEKAFALQKLVKETYGVEALAIKADIRIEEEVKKLIQEIMTHFGRLDVLVNNAGIVMDKEFEDREVKDFQDTIDTNVIGTFLVSKYGGLEMLKQKQGAIINISSTNGIDTFFPTSLDYDATKAAIISLTHNLAVQYAPFIRVNAIAPGWVNTPMNQDLSEEFVKEEASKIYLKRFAEPEEIANVIYFLASDEASYVNNAIIRIDGGY